jgi:two-component system, chemotaxis family, sensor kinase CheA
MPVAGTPPDATVSQARVGERLVTPEEIRALFIEEATASLQELEAALLRLEEFAGDPEAVNLIFRIAHSLKGGSSMMGYTEITRLTHSLEGLLQQIREGARPVTSAVIDTLLASADVLHGFVAQIAGGQHAEPTDSSERVHALLAELLDHTETTQEETLPSAVDVTPTLYRIDFRPTADALRRGLDPLRVLAQLAELGEVQQVVPDLTGLPPLAELRPEESYLAWTVTLLTSHHQESLKEFLAFAAGADGVRLTPMDEPAPAAPVQAPRRRA